MIDSRLVGTISENIFLWLLNERGIFTTSFDTAGLDGISFDYENRYFRVGQSPFYVQIKCRGSKGQQYNPQGHGQEVFDKMLNVAYSLQIPETSLYFVVGFFNNDDIRTVVYYAMPINVVSRFKVGHYRFSVKRCEEEMEKDNTIFRL
jgi:hypothetical protein